MAQQQREENSVLFSLKELRRLEDDRIQQEADAVRAKAEAERRAREEAERRAREEVERRRREEEDRVRRIEDERLAREREEQLRLQEAERRARVEGEMRLQEERMRLELTSRKQAKSPVGIIAGAIVVVLVLAGAVVWKLRAYHLAEKAAAQAAAQAALEAAKAEAARAEAAAEARFKNLLSQKEEELKAAKSEEDKARIRSEIERERARRNNGRKPSDAPKQDTGSKVPTIKQKTKVGDDPLEGLKL